MYSLHVPLLSVEEAENLDNADATDHIALQRQGQRRHKAVKPVCRLQDPIPMPFVVAHPSSHHAPGKGHNNLR